MFFLNVMNSKITQNLLRLRVSHDQCVKDVFVDGQLLFAHELQDSGGAFDVTLLTVPRDQTLIGYSKNNINKV